LEWYNFKKSASGFSGTSGSTIYSMGGINFCTISNTGVNVNNAYLLSEPYEINAYTDLAKNVDNPFISGTTSAPSVGSAYRFQLVIPKQQCEYKSTIIYF
jgi:hypothetical protein